MQPWQLKELCKTRERDRERKGGPGSPFAAWPGEAARVAMGHGGLEEDIWVVLSVMLSRVKLPPSSCAPGVNQRKLPLDSS